MSTFAKKFAATADHEIFLVTGIDFTGQSCWYFMKIIKSRAAQFEAMVARGELTNLTEHGTLILSGYGTTPPPSAYEQVKTAAA